MADNTIVTDVDCSKGKCPLTEEVLFSEGSISVSCEDGIPRIKVVLPKERNNTLTLYAAEAFVTMLALLQTGRFDGVITQAIIKAGVKSEQDHLAQNIVNAKNELMFPLTASPAKPSEETERIQSDQTFTPVNPNLDLDEDEEEVEDEE